MSSDTAAEVLADAEDKMQKSVVRSRADFGSVRTGRASPALVERLVVEAYGQELPLIDLAGFQVPEARTLLITPYDRANLGPIEKAIQHSDLGLNPSNDGNNIRLSFPQLTTERRKEMVKRVKGMAEEGRVGIRNARRDARKQLDQLEKSGNLSQDELARAADALDKLTQRREADIDKACAEKEQELLEV